MKNSLLMIVVGGVGLLSIPAFADITPIGDPIPSQSWGQTFQFKASAGSYDQFQFHMLTPSATFEAPSIRNFTVTNWSDADKSESFALAVGAPTSQLTIQVTFNGVSGASLAFDFAGFRVGENQASETAGLYWNGTSWSVSNVVTSYDRVSMTEPSAWMLILLETIGAVGFALLMKNRYC
jgi:hypothetical protein